MTGLLPSLNSDLSELADRVRRSLVRVTVESSGTGSGVVMAVDGLVVTNAHVVAVRRPGAGGLQITLPDGSVTAGQLLAKDDDIDVALVRIDPVEGKLPELSPIEVGGSKNLRSGQWVMAMGHPGGVAGAAVAGIVIGAGPDLPEAPGSDRYWVAVDLSLRPGHSGGPLVDHQGRLIGMSTMMAGLEVGMAVPAHVIEEFVAKVAAGDMEAGSGKTELM